MADVERIVGYRVDREISRSSIASVYQGYQESLEREVLIKRLHPQFVRDPEIRARFEREAHALARIKHKNIVHIYDYLADDENMVLVQEWIGGGSVAEYMQRHGPLTEAEAIALAIDVLEGLDVAHKSKVIHRDIKPSNMMLAPQGSIKITDFGLAQFEGAAALTQQGAIMGTPAYMAPEMVNGQAATARCDLYSLGVTLYEVLAGENPFQADHISQTLQRVLSAKPGKLGGVHDDTNRLLQALVAKDPAQRPATAGDVLDMMMPLARELGVEKGWEAAGRPKTSDLPAGETPVPRATTITHSFKPSRRATPPRFVVIAAATLMVLTLAAVWLFTSETGARLLRGAPSTPADADLADLPSDNPADQGTGDDLAEGEDGTSAEPSPADSPAEPQGDSATDPGDETPTGTDDESGGPGSGEPGAPEPSDQADDDRAEPASGDEVESDSPPPSDGIGSGDQPDGAADDTALADGSTDNGELDPVDAVPATSSRPDSGHVLLSVHPWAHVYWRDTEIGTTPLVTSLHLPAGRQVLNLINPQFPPIDEVVLVPGGNDTLQISVDLLAEVGVIEFIDAIPWAEVSLDGEYLGRTPIGRSIFVQPGEHTLIFRHPSLVQQEETFVAEPGGEPFRFRVNMIP